MLFLLNTHLSCHIRRYTSRGIAFIATFIAMTSSHDNVKTDLKGIVLIFHKRKNCSGSTGIIRHQQLLRNDNT